MAAVVLGTAQLAMAHPGHSQGGLSEGLWHPLGGWDHLLAMIAVGVWAAQLGGKAKWIVPGAFLGFMAAGGALAKLGVPMHVGVVESGIAASVLVLGLLVAGAWRLPLVAAGGCVGLFALFHGYAHMSELAEGQSAALFAVGFLISTAMLHLVGLGGGLLLQRAKMPKMERWVGAGVAAASVAIWFGFL
jgi:urease accessory protein